MRRQPDISRIRLILTVISAFLLAPAFCHAAKDFVMPTPQPAKTYAAHDEHPSEAVTVGLDPYDTEDKAKIFTIHYNDMGIVPIFVVITNDGDQPVVLAGMKAQLVTGDRTKLDPDNEDDIYRRIAHPHASATNRYPLPFPSKKVKGAVDSKTIAEIQSAQFGAKAVEPHSTQAGFLFFDVSEIPNPLVGAHLYLTGVRDAKGDELMYFEVAVQKTTAVPAQKQ